MIIKKLLKKMENGCCISLEETFFSHTLDSRFSNRHLFEFRAYSKRFPFPVDFPKQTHAHIHQLFEPAVIQIFI